MANEEIEINDQILNDGGLDVTTYSTTIDNGDGGRPVTLFDLPYTEDDEYSATRDESIVSSTILQRYKQGTTNKKKNWVMISLATVALACIIGVIVSVSSDSLRTKNSVNNSNTVSSSIPAMPWVVDQESVASEVDDGAPPEEDGAYRLYTDRQIGTASAKAEKEATRVRCGKSGKGSKGSTSKGGTGKSGKSKSSKAKSGKSGSGKAGKGSKADADCPSTKSNKGSATKAENTKGASKEAASTKGKGGTRMLLLRNGNLKQRKNHRTVKGRD